MQILDGRALAQNIKDDLKKRIQSFCETHKSPPGLAIALIGKNPASQVYVRQKMKAAKEVGIQAQQLELPESISPQKLKKIILGLSTDSQTQAILVQLPLPPSLRKEEVISWIHPEKDPDCLTIENQGLAWSEQARVFSCTPLGIMKLLQHYNIPIKSKQAVIVGRSQIVGKPMAQMLLQAHATVTICNSHTIDMSSITQRADIVIAAAGKQDLLGKKDLKKGAVVIDVGIHRIQQNGRTLLKGDVRAEELKDWVSFLSPVPGGVGPMTVAMLLENTYHLACLQKQKN